MKTLTDGANTFQVAMVTRAPAMTQAQSSGNVPDQIRLYNLAGDDMLEFEKLLTFTVPQLATAFEGSLKAYYELQKMIAGEMPELQPNFTDASASFTDLYGVVGQTREVVSGLRDLVTSIPPFTGRLRSAKQRLATALNSYIASMTIIKSQFEAIFSDKEL